MNCVRLIRFAFGSLIIVLALAATAVAGTVTYTNGDTTYESVYFGYGGASQESLSNVLAGYVDPLTGAPSAITNPDGTPLVVGCVDLGENPAASNQTQIQRFFTDTDQQYKLTYVGLGYAGYLNITGLYTYEVGETDPANFAYTPLVTQGVNPAGTEVLFNVAANHYFGFYLSADGGRTERNRFFSENQYNLDGHGTETDHVLMFETNRGLLLAWEDLPLGSDGKLGDQDYEDMIGGLLTYGDGSHVPEPATMILLGGGLGVMLLSRVRDSRRQA